MRPRTVSSTSQPPSAQSVAENRTATSAAGAASFTAVTTRRSSRVRFSNDPPYSSVRRFDSGERNWWSRYPCAAWISSTVKPAATARRAADAKFATTWSIPV